MINPVYFAKLTSVKTAARLANMAGKPELSDKLAEKSWSIFHNQIDKEATKIMAR